MKIVKKIQPKILIFTEVKNRCILHGRVFVMLSLHASLRVVEIQSLIKSMLSKELEINIRNHNCVRKQELKSKAEQIMCIFHDH